MGRKVSRYCRTCGAMAPERGRFCASCGASLNLTSPFPQPPSADHPTATPIAPAMMTTSVSGSVQMGFGIALGMVLFFALVIALIVVVIGFATSTITWPFAQQGQRFEGVGPADSAPLALEGEYRVEWTATPTSPSACNLRATLVSQKGPVPEITLVRSAIEAAPAPISGHAAISVGAATYMIRVESGCRWSIRLVRP